MIRKQTSATGLAERPPTDHPVRLMFVWMIQVFIISIRHASETGRGLALNWIQVVAVGQLHRKPGHRE
jgi:hypothetical protein